MLLQKTVNSRRGSQRVDAELIRLRVSRTVFRRVVGSVNRIRAENLMVPQQHMADFVHDGEPAARFQTGVIEIDIPDVARDRRNAEVDQHVPDTRAESVPAGHGQFLA